MRTKQSLIISAVLIVAILGLVNFLGEKYFFRLDLTEDNRYTLSKATLDILDSLDRPVTVKAYFSSNLPARVSQSRKRFKDLLIEYANRSGGNLVYEFVDPSEDKEIEKQARRNGVQPVMLSVRKENEMKQQQTYMGAVIKYGNESESIPVIKPQAPMEYKLSSSIKQLTVEHKPVVGLMQGHGEPSQRKLSQVKKELSVLFNVQPVQMTDTTRLSPSEYKTIAIVAPSDTFPEAHLQALDRYVAQGGNLFVALNRVKGNMQRAMGMPNDTRLASWLAKKGIKVKKNFVVDNQAGRVTVSSSRGGMQMRRMVKFPYLPIVTDFADHPVVKGIERVQFKFASTLQFTGDTTMTFKTLARTSEHAGTETPPLRFNVRKEWGKDDFPESNLPLAAAVEGRFNGGSQSRMVVVGDGDFPVGGRRQRVQEKRVQESNVNLMVNAIEWLSDDTGLIALRTRGVSTRPLEETEASTKTLLKYTNFLLPILLIIIYGMIRNQLNNLKREKRKNEDYGQTVRE